jgi:hypothetical protein
MTTAQPSTPRLDTHPAYRDTVGRYRIALAAYDFLEGVLSEPLLSERTYCDAFVRANFHPFTWVSANTAGQDWTQAHADAAFEEAKRG